MERVSRPFSISLGPGHEKHITDIENRIRREAKKPHTNRSEAVQIALLNLIKPGRDLSELVQQNQLGDKRRKSP